MTLSFIICFYRLTNTLTNTYIFLICSESCHGCIMFIIYGDLNQCKSYVSWCFTLEASSSVQFWSASKNVYQSTVFHVTEKLCFTCAHWAQVVCRQSGCILREPAECIRRLWRDFCSSVDTQAAAGPACPRWWGPSHLLSAAPSGGQHAPWGTSWSWPPLHKAMLAPLCSQRRRKCVLRGQIHFNC